MFITFFCNKNLLLTLQLRHKHQVFNSLRQTKDTTQDLNKHNNLMELDPFLLLLNSNNNNNNHNKSQVTKLQWQPEHLEVPWPVLWWQAFSNTTVKLLTATVVLQTLKGEVLSIRERWLVRSWILEAVDIMEVTVVDITIKCKIISESLNFVTSKINIETRKEGSSY